MPEQSLRTTNGPRSIHPAIRKVWLFSNAITFLIVLIASSGFETLILKASHAPWRFPIIMPIFWIIMWIISASLVKKQWQAWKYEVTEHEAILCHGLLTQVRRHVPRDRIQHLDITAGPIARKFGLVHVHLYVAGAHGTVGEIPGLTNAEAEDLRAMLIGSQAAHV